MGLPTPNIYAGGNEFHSVREWVSVQDMAVSRRDGGRAAEALGRARVAGARCPVAARTRSSHGRDRRSSIVTFVASLDRPVTGWPVSSAVEGGGRPHPLSGGGRAEPRNGAEPPRPRRAARASRETPGSRAPRRARGSRPAAGRGASYISSVSYTSTPPLPPFRIGQPFAFSSASSRLSALDDRVAGQARRGAAADRRLRAERVAHVDDRARRARRTTRSTRP